MLNVNSGCCADILPSKPSVLHGEFGWISFAGLSRISNPTGSNEPRHRGPLVNGVSASQAPLQWQAVNGRGVAVVFVEEGVLGVCLAIADARRIGRTCGSNISDRDVFTRCTRRFTFQPTGLLFLYLHFVIGARPILILEEFDHRLLSLLCRNALRCILSSLSKSSYFGVMPIVRAHLDEKVHLKRKVDRENAPSRCNPPIFTHHQTNKG